MDGCATQEDDRAKLWANCTVEELDARVDQFSRIANRAYSSFQQRYGQGLSAADFEEAFDGALELAIRRFELTSDVSLAQTTQIDSDKLERQQFVFLSGIVRNLTSQKRRSNTPCTHNAGREARQEGQERCPKCMRSVFPILLTSLEFPVTSPTDSASQFDDSGSAWIVTDHQSRDAGPTETTDAEQPARTTAHIWLDQQLPVKEAVQPVRDYLASIRGALKAEFDEIEGGRQCLDVGIEQTTDEKAEQQKKAKRAESLLSKLFELNDGQVAVLWYLWSGYEWPRGFSKVLSVWLHEAEARDEGVDLKGLEHDKWPKKWKERVGQTRDLVNHWKPRLKKVIEKLNAGFLGPRR